MNASGKLHYPGVANYSPDMPQAFEKIGDPNGFRTRVSTLKGTRHSSVPNRLRWQTSNDLPTKMGRFPREWQTFSVLME